MKQSVLPTLILGISLFLIDSKSFGSGNSQSNRRFEELKRLSDQSTEIMKNRVSLQGKIDAIESLYLKAENAGVLSSNISNKSTENELIANLFIELFLESNLSSRIAGLVNVSADKGPLDLNGHEILGDFLYSRREPIKIPGQFWRLFRLEFGVELLKNYKPKILQVRRNTYVTENIEGILCRLLSKSVVVETDLHLSDEYRLAYLYSQFIVYVELAAVRESKEFQSLFQNVVKLVSGTSFSKSDFRSNLLQLVRGLPEDESVMNSACNRLIHDNIDLILQKR